MNDYFFSSHTIARLRITQNLKWICKALCSKFLDYIITIFNYLALGCLMPSKKALGLTVNKSGLRAKKYNWFTGIGKDKLQGR